MLSRLSKGELIQLLAELTMKKKSKMPTPPSYDGKPQMFDSFMYQVETYTKHEHIETDREKIEFTIALLRDDGLRHATEILHALNNKEIAFIEFRDRLSTMLGAKINPVVAESCLRRIQGWKKIADKFVSKTRMFSSTLSSQKPTKGVILQFNSRTFSHFSR